MPNQLRTSLLIFIWLCFTTTVFAQSLPRPISDSTTISQYVLFADGTHRGMNDSVRYGLQLSANSSISRSQESRTIIGSNFMVTVGNHNDLVTDIYSGNRINMTAGGN